MTIISCMRKVHSIDVIFNQVFGQKYKTGLGAKGRNRRYIKIN